MAGSVQQSSDVRFREIDLSTIIRSRDSSRAAILFVSKKGRPGRYLVNDSQMFKDEYGIPDAAVSFGHYCGLNALNEIANMECVRVLGSAYAWAGVIMKIADAAPTVTLLAGQAVLNPDIPDWDTYVSGTETPLLLFTPKSGPGSYANSLAISISSQNLKPPAAPTATPSAGGGTLANGSYSYSITAIGEMGETLPSTATAATVTGGPGKVTLQWAEVVGARGYKVYGRTAGTLRLMATLGSTARTFVDDASITPNAAISAPVAAPAITPIFQVNVFDLNVSGSAPVETWNTTLTDYVDGNGTQLEATQQINSFSKYISVDSYIPISNDPIAIYATARTTMTGGDSGSAPTNGQISAAWDTYFGDPEQSQVNILINAGYTDIGVQTKMASVAEGRGDAFAILDVPSAKQGPQDAISYRQLELNLNTSYAALYTSDIFVTDEDNNKRLYVPPSGWVAAVYGRTDRVAGPQFQPAGMNRGLVDALKLRQEYSEPQRTNLFNAQVNYIRRFLGEGTAVFEATTLQAKASALSWVSVRRMLNVIKVSLKDFLMYSLHEPNDDFTRSQIVSASTDYLQSWKDARGILDFQVISDSSNNPAAQYNLGILKVTIFVTPIIPVHEIQVDIVITKAGMDWSEINISNLG